MQFSREFNLLLKSDNSSMEIFKYLYVIEFQGGYVRLNIIIHPSNMRGALMNKLGLNCQSLYFMSMGVDNLVDLKCHRTFYTGVIIQFHQQ